MFSGMLGLIHLFCIFFYVGLFAIGGGLVAATFMQQVLVEKYAVISQEKFYQMIAVSESTPGPIGINLATYCGCELYGPVGGFVTTFGEVLPSIIIIMLIAKFFADFQKKPLVKSVFAVLRPATAGMVLVALANVFFITVLNVPSLREGGRLSDLVQLREALFYLLATGTLFFAKKIHPVFIVAAGAVFGVLFL